VSAARIHAEAITTAVLLAMTLAASAAMMVLLFTPVH